MSHLRVEPPRFEHHRHPLGIGEPAPRLSWLITTDIPGWLQRAYEIELSDEAGRIPVRGFLGDYDVSVSSACGTLRLDAPGRVTTVVTLEPGDSET